MASSEYDFTKSFTCNSNTTDTVTVEFIGMPDTVLVEVLDLDDKFVKDIEFRVNDKQLEYEYGYSDDATSEMIELGEANPTHYIVNIDDYEELFEIMLSQDDANFTKTLTCDIDTVDMCTVEFSESIFTMPEDSTNISKN